jgi:hypothetical protein
MTAFSIKLIAMLTMVVDHSGLYFFPQYWSLRIIGRLSFILFAWLIANGARHTKDTKKYMLRLLALGLVAQYPFYLLNEMSNVVGSGLNIGFTLSMGLLMILIHREVSSGYIKLLYFTLIIAGAQILNVDYGPAGVLSILLFYVYFDDLKAIVLSQSAVYLSFNLVPLIYKFSSGDTLLTSLDVMKLIQPLALLSLVFVYLYNKKPGYKDRYLLYLFYPGHFVLMILIKHFIGY